MAEAAVEEGEVEEAFVGKKTGEASPTVLMLTGKRP